MWRQALSLARQDLRFLFREKTTWTRAFVLPIVFFYFLGNVTGRAAEPEDADKPIFLAGAEEAGFLAGELERRLEDLGFRVERIDAGGLDAEGLDAEGLDTGSRRLSLGPGFTASVLAGKPMEIGFERVGGDLRAGYDDLRIKRAVYALLADLVVLATDAAGEEPTAAAFEALAAAPRTLTVEVRPAGERQEVPRGFDQAVPGIMVMFTLLVMFTTGGVSLLQERQRGILRRLASAPLSRRAVVLGKWASRYALGVVQIAWAMIIGTVLFGVDWGPRLPTLCGVLLAYAALAAAAGVLLGNFGRSEGQVAGLGLLSAMVLAALGGCWWPLEITPLWAQKLALALPTGWAMDALHKLVSFGASPASVVPHLVAMTVAAVAAGWVVARSFRFH